MKIIFEINLKDYQDFSEFLDLLSNCDPFPKFNILKAPKKWLIDSNYLDEEGVKK